MVLLPCSSCCQTPCGCPTCSCCQCDDWQTYFDQTAVSGSPGYYYLDSANNLSLYDALVRTNVCNLTRPWNSQQECVDYWTAQIPGYPGDFAADGELCGEWYSWSGTSVTAGWSAPLIDGQAATPTLLESLCPGGAPPPDLNNYGSTFFYGTGQFTGAGTPDIHKLVFKSGSSTGDPIADALFVRGTRNDLPDLPWQEADDCGSCANPPAYEYDCDPATDDKRFYAKTVDWEFTYPTQDPQEPACPPTGTDPLGLCPPQNCKQVTITVTRTDKCGSTDVVTVWRAIVFICPCLITPIIGVDSETGDLWQAAYGYDSEAACIADWNNANCIGNQWQQVRHEIDGGNRQLMPQDCCSAGAGGYYC